jgi:hypothetical protein
MRRVQREISVREINAKSGCLNLKGVDDSDILSTMP